MTQKKLNSPLFSKWSQADCVTGFSLPLHWRVILGSPGFFPSSCILVMNGCRESEWLNTLMYRAMGEKSPRHQLLLSAWNQTHTHFLFHPFASVIRSIMVQCFHWCFSESDAFREAQLCMALLMHVTHTQMHMTHAYHPKQRHWSPVHLKILDFGWQFHIFI